MLTGAVAPTRAAVLERLWPSHPNGSHPHSHPFRASDVNFEDNFGPAYIRGAMETRWIHEICYNQHRLKELFIKPGADPQQATWSASFTSQTSDRWVWCLLTIKYFMIPFLNPCWSSYASLTISKKFEINPHNSAVKEAPLHTELTHE